ncbi:MAG: TolC family protein [Flavobacteriia bacterium]|nr:TolC family protein [Flavobacteriia bacterium]
MDQLISVHQMNREAVKAEIIRDIKKSYYELWYLEQKKNLYSRMDSMYSSQFQAANIRYNTGDVPGLDRISAEAKMNENVALKLQIEKEIEILQKRLMLLTNRQELYLPEEAQLPKLEISGLESVGTHPSLLVQQQEIEVSKSLIEVQKQQNHPDFSIRAFSQVYLGEKDPISGFSLGMSFPLFGLRQMKNRTEAIRQEVELKETELNWQKMNLSSMQQQSLTEVDKQKVMIDFYENSGLKDADAIISAATLSYRSGEISFAEMNTFIIQAISIKDKYLESLNLYNQSVIEYNYLINQN